MGDRRMFSNRVINSAKFLKMPLSTQALYFHLGMRADDDGVVEAYSVMRSLGVNEDDLRILISKEFVIVLNEDLVCYIADWNENNIIRSDRKRDSIYQELLIKVIPNVELLEKKRRADTGQFSGIKDSAKNEDSIDLIPQEIPQISDGRPVDVHWTTTGPSMDGLSKDKLIKESNPLLKESITKEKSQNCIENTPDFAENAENLDYRGIFDSYNSICTSLPRIKHYSQERKNTIKSRAREFGVDSILDAFRKVYESDFLSGRSDNSYSGVSFDWIMKKSNFVKILEGNYDNSRFARASPLKRTGHDGFKTDYGKDSFEEVSL